MEEKSIKLLRDKIDQLDNQLLDIIIKRTEIVDEIGILKNNNKKVVDNKRENQVLSRLLDMHKGNFSKDSLVRIWREIFYTSAKIQLKTNDIFSPKREINNIKVYKGGISNIVGKDKIIKLSSNESPFGPSYKAVDAYKKSSEKLSRYPELTAQSLQKKIAEKFNLNHNQIICGTGSDEILIFITLAFCSPGDEVIHSEHGFEMYPIVTKYAGAISKLASEINYKTSIESIIEKVNSSTKVIFIANPNNPTSTYLSKNELKTLIEKVPEDVIIVIDGAYAEFADADDYDKTFSLVEKHKNVIITRTFSKAYSLAGLRLGWAYAGKELIEIIKKLRPPFNLPPGAIAAGIAALEDDDHLEKVIKHNKEIKSWFTNELKSLGLKAYDTQTNFVFVEIPNTNNVSAELLNNYLLSKGIAVRYLLSYGLENALRITFGTKKELELTIREIKNFINKNENI